MSDVKSESKTVQVPNISCSHCVHTIETEIGEIPGVMVVKADEGSKQVNIQWQGPTTWDDIESKLVEIEYPPAGKPNVTIK
jgi:copper chaperone